MPDPLSTIVIIRRITTLSNRIHYQWINEYNPCQNSVIILRPTRRINQSVRKSISNLKCTSSRRVRHYDYSKTIGTKSRSEQIVVERYHWNRVIVGNPSNEPRVRTLAHQQRQVYSHNQSASIMLYAILKLANLTLEDRRFSTCTLRGEKKSNTAVNNSKVDCGCWDK